MKLLPLKWIKQRSENNLGKLLHLLETNVAYYASRPVGSTEDNTTEHLGSSIAHDRVPFYLGQDNLSSLTAKTEKEDDVRCSRRLSDVRERQCLYTVIRREVECRSMVRKTKSYWRDLYSVFA